MILIYIIIFFLDWFKDYFVAFPWPTPLPNIMGQYLKIFKRVFSVTILNKNKSFLKRLETVDLENALKY